MQMIHGPVARSLVRRVMVMKLRNGVITATRVVQFHETVVSAMNVFYGIATEGAVPSIDNERSINSVMIFPIL